MPEAGRYRAYNITKKEWVLNGDTVLYAPADIIDASLEYDFSQEKHFSYRGLSKAQAVRHIASFISGIWQIHPFCEGNTRTTAVFAIRYLASLGFQANNEPFKQNSWYFRNALVRANYENIDKGIYGTQTYLDCFFENLLLEGKNELKNRYLHVDWQADKPNDLGVANEIAQQVTQQVTQQVEAVLLALGDDELSLRDLMGRVGLRDRNSFTKNYLKPALEAGLVERTIPDKPRSRLQKYRKVNGSRSD